MKNLYNCYGDNDKIVLIGKREEFGTKILDESVFEYSDELENKYLIFDYNEEHGILNNGFRHVFNVKINNCLEELCVFYNENGDIEDFGIKDENGYREVYIKYDADKFRGDLKRVITEFEEFYLVIMNEISEESKIIFNYLYTGESIEIYFEIANNKIYLKENIVNTFETLILSVAKDELVDDYETFMYVIKAVYDCINSRFKNITLIEIRDNE